MKAILVVECDEADVVRLRKTIHATAETRDVVFREKSHRANAGVNLYQVCVDSLDTIFGELHRIRRERGY